MADEWISVRGIITKTLHLVDRAAIQSLNNGVLSKNAHIVLTIDEF